MVSAQELVEECQKNSQREKKEIGEQRKEMTKKQIISDAIKDYCDDAKMCGNEAHDTLYLGFVILEALDKYEKLLRKKK